ncbi:MAG: dihydrolipoyl dehydrogenase [Gammaproteobacteria bacterium]|nr:dihydrolipoyl dehydrogenase [Gammaproteobacteria bacterium]
MSKELKVEVPDIGEFTDVDIIEILVAEGDQVNKDDSLITLETDKASLEVPSPATGKVNKILLQVGQKVSKGSPILLLTVEETVTEQNAPSPSQPHQQAQTIALPSGIESDIHVEVVVLGSGPGGYTAAFRAADLGKSVALIERYPNLGGVCLNVGCIPSKALLHTAQIINEAAEMSEHGVSFNKPKIDLLKLAGWKDSVIKKLTGGLAAMAKQRKVQIINGNGRFLDAHRIEVEGKDGKQIISFENVIIAAGSQPVKIPGFPHDDKRMLDSTDALLLTDAPKRLLVVGGGIIGLEMAMVYAALGSKITIVELLDGLIPGCDRDLVRPLEKIIKARYENIYVGTKVTAIKATGNGMEVSFEGSKAPAKDLFDKVLVAVGRKPNGHNIGAENAGIQVDERGFIPVDKQQRTNITHIFAIGDIVGQPMLAHKATHEGKVAAEVIAGHKTFFDARTIPSVAYTDPEVAWTGLTEEQAKKDGIEYEKAAFPWAASGRSLSLGRSEGMTKLLLDKTNRRLLGAGIVGPNAGELIAEASLAVEMGSDMEDISLTIHPHPTLSETINFAAEIAEGTITDLYIPKRNK